MQLLGDPWLSTECAIHRHTRPIQYPILGIYCHVCQLLRCCSTDEHQQPGHLQWAMLVCFGFTFLFSNFGPNTITFVLPVEIYPTLVRATCHGISAAAGKVGAVIGVVAFSPCEKAFGMSAVLAGCGVVCIVGAVFTFFFTVENTSNLEDLDKATETKA